MKTVSAAIVAAVVIAASVLSATAYVSLVQPQASPAAASALGHTSTYAQGYPPVGGSMMGAGGVPGTGVPGAGPSSAGPGFPSGTVGVDEAIAAMRSPPAYVTVDKTGNTLTFGSQEPSVQVLAMMPDDAANLTGMQPPSYSSGDVFVIYGLINPTLVFQPGARLNITVANLDDDMYHNFVLTTLAPPYSYVMMASGMGPGMMYNAENEFLSTMPMLPPVNDSQGYAFSYSYSLTLNASANIWYVCTYPGHAQSGMYGEVSFAS